MTSISQKIKALCCAEPRRADEYPICYGVGHDGVSEITESTENLGTYGIHWFHVWKDGIETSRINASGVVEVIFFPPAEGGAA